MWVEWALPRKLLPKRWPGDDNDVLFVLRATSFYYAGIFYLFILPTHHICRVSVRKKVQPSRSLMLRGVASSERCGTNYPSVF